ncbi:MAG: phosphate ABC transporter permease PstA [Anaerolineae bacterium]
MATLAAEGLLAKSSNRGNIRRRYFIDGLLRVLVTLAAAIGVALLFLIIAYIVLKGLPAWNLEFFIGHTEPVGVAQGGIGQAIVGTIMMLIVACILGIPLGIAAAIYLSEYGRGAFAEATQFTIETIAGVPSIVVGSFIWAFLVKNIMGTYSGLAGGISIGIIMIPIVARTAQEVLRLVPDSLREASLALGIPYWKTVLYIVLPTARAGLVTAVVLAAARAGGESAPLLLTALGNDFYNFDLLKPMSAIPLIIYKYALSPYEEWHQQAWGAALVLIVVIGIVSLATRWTVARSARHLRR